MPTAKANGIEIEYETIGRSDDPALLLVMGLSAQLIAWPDGFCALLAERGFHVIRFDNRDVGLSTKVADTPKADIAAAFAGDATSAAYTLDDMADDAVGLLDALGISSAHVVGASMGGMIAQTIAVRHPERVRSLCSLTSTTGAPEGFAISEEALAVLLTPSATTRAEAVENRVRASRVIGSTAFPFDEAAERELAERSYDRCHYPVGIGRQLVAIHASGDRTEALGSVDVPTVVIHGSVDPLVPPVGGELTARAIPGAQLVMIEGMGHDLPEPVWPTVVESIVANAE